MDYLTLSGINLDPGFKIALEVFDYGTNGAIVASGQLLVKGNIVTYNQRFEFSAFTASPEIVILDISDCTVLSLNVRTTVDALINHNCRTNVYIAKQQGRGNLVFTGSLGGLDLYRANQFNYPGQQLNQYATPWGIPKHFDFLFADGVWKFKVPENYLLKPIYASINITCDATVANRIVGINLFDNALLTNTFAHNGVVTAGMTRTVVFRSSYTQAGYAAFEWVQGDFIHEYIDNYFSFVVNVIGIEPGDVLSTPVLYAYTIYVGNSI